jgi:hypothetical protein
VACGCNKNKQQFEVVSAEGKVVYTSTSEPTAKAVARRYEGSTVRSKGGAQAQQAKETSG